MLILPNRNGFSSSPQWVQQLDQWRPMACWTSLFFPVGSGLILQPTMGPTAGPMVCWTSLIFQIRSGLVLQPAMGPAAGPMACPLWVQQLDQWHAGQACSSHLGVVYIIQHIMGPAAAPMACWTSLFSPVGSG